MSNLRRNRAVDQPLTGPVLATSRLARPCPKCEAAPGQSCRRWIGGRVRGKDVGGGYWRLLKNTHPERKRNSTQAVDGEECAVD